MNFYVGSECRIDIVVVVDVVVADVVVVVVAISISIDVVVVVAISISIDVDVVVANAAFGVVVVAVVVALLLFLDRVCDNLSFLCKLKIEIKLNLQEVGKLFRKMINLINGFVQRCFDGLRAATFDRK